MMRSAAVSTKTIIKWKCKTKKEAVLQSFVESRICNNATGSLSYECARMVNRRTCECPKPPSVHISICFEYETYWFFSFVQQKKKKQHIKISIFHVSIFLFSWDSLHRINTSSSQQSLSKQSKFPCLKSVIFSFILFGKFSTLIVEKTILSHLFVLLILDNVFVSYMSNLTISVIFFLLVETFVQIL